MMTQREKFYANRIGKIYGTYRVLAVEYDEKAENHQLWTCECIRCGKVIQTRYGKEFVKGRSGKTCECMTKKFNKTPAPTYAEKMEKYKGQAINDWKIIKYEQGNGFLCECIHCGRIAYKNAKTLINGKASKCICRVNQTKYDENWIGRKFNHLTIVGLTSKVEKNGHKHIYFNCVCDCGNTIAVRPIYLIKGQTKCCGSGCKHKGEYAGNKLDVGSVKHPLYRKLMCMRSRCGNSNNPNYKEYGGRGIKVCDEWQGREGFYNFYKWSMENGWKDGLTIDRIDPDGNYEPSNCRYITLSENAKRARKPYTITPKEYKKKTKYSDVKIFVGEKCVDIKTATKIFGVSYNRALYWVSKKGMTWQEAFEYLTFKPKWRRK